ncbi:RagB/SusD family nutrient uptake outer membrane protein [Chitinophaga cymbidii]|uniref:Membrane protein n=1 Tax=Chitinophaga cymbidii TaxID=1096750 RepID=A0A512REA3_9BACT|nr:RagB/SusD family nutrient uptake outer membrane protein [Chitinophaga cymbidii]GEP93954.1 membrane protein [Chitinophaga cymbidii]
MKRTIHILLIFSLVCSSCLKDALDKQPLDTITDAVVWNDQALINAYLTQVYLQFTILTNETPDASGSASDDWNGPFIINELSDECMRNWIYGQSQAKMYAITISGGVLDWWESSYSAIRTLNEFIKRVPEAPVDENFRKVRTAEARFLRAFSYFSMVKRYGGVPLITEPQDINASYEELYRKRDKEQQVYDFILAELDAAIPDLPERGETEYGRPSRYTALALKSRAALYAASIAKYGTVQLDGLVGIAAAPDGYYQQAFDAADDIMKSGQYDLYDVDADKVTNFKNVFLKENNIEVIWAKQHDYTQRNLGGNGWVWDFFQAPKPHAWNAGNQNAPYLEMAEEFEHVGGTPGTLNRTAVQQGVWSMEELWGDKDPRFYASIYTQNTPWKGGRVDFHNGLQLPDGTIQTSGSYQNVPAKGDQMVDNSFGPGFGVMKYLEETKDNMGERATSGTDWQIFRYAEVLLNYAEAAFELNHAPEALSAINDIRERAGIREHTSIDMEKIRHERKVELAFEGHRYWDLRRWRTAEDVLTGPHSGMRYILDYTTGKYKLEIIDQIDGTSSDPVFYERNYYLPITNARRGNNPNLDENPGYQ